MSEQYDLIVIGAGPGGYVAAIKAAQMGKRVLLAENRQVGGTCLNRGCIPTKTLLQTAHLAMELRRGASAGLRVRDISLDTDALSERRDEVVHRLRGGLENLLQANQIDLQRGRAVITSPRRIAIGESSFEASRLLIATGSRPALPPIPGPNLPGVLTSDELLTGKPEFQSLTIIGGGVIGVEFASIYNAFGIPVTILEAADRILPTLDREVSQNLAMILKKRGVKIHTKALVESVEQEPHGLICRFKERDQSLTVLSEIILAATGRRANTDGLLAGTLDLAVDRGQIPVDDRFETCIPGIYAIGDVILGSASLAHAASAQGVNAVSAMFGESMPIQAGAVPACIYTCPEIACAGLSAEQAKERGIAVVTGKALSSANGRSVIADSERGFLKLLFHAETHVLLGAAMMCDRATDMISELTTAISQRLTLEQLASVIRPHPTFSEMITEAAEDAAGRSIHAMPRRR